MTIIDMTGQERIPVDSSPLWDKMLQKYRKLYYLIAWAKARQKEAEK